MKKLLLSLVAALALTGVAYAQNFIPLFTGPQDPALDQYYNNTMLQAINGLPSNHIFQQSSPLTGVTETLTGPWSIDVNLTPAGTIAANTVVFPTTPQNGQQVTIFTSQTITALTLTATTIVGGVTTLTGPGSVAYQYQASNTTWYRVR